MPAQVLDSVLFVRCMAVLLGLVVIMNVHSFSPALGAVLCGSLTFWATSAALKNLLNQEAKRHSVAQDSYFDRCVDAVLTLVQARHDPAVQTPEPDSCFSEDTPLQDGIAPTTDFHGPPYRREVKTFVRHISTEYVQSWYTSVSGHQEFPTEVEYFLEDVLVAICGRLAKLDVELAVRKLVMLYCRHLSLYLEDPDATGPKRGRHPALLDQQTEWSYLVAVTRTLLKMVSPPEVLACPVVHTVLVNILAQNVLHRVMIMLSDPKWINRALVLLLSDNASESDQSGSNGLRLDIAVSEPLDCADGKSTDLLSSDGNPAEVRDETDTETSRSGRNSPMPILILPENDGLLSPCTSEHTPEPLSPVEFGARFPNYQKMVELLSPTTPSHRFSVSSKSSPLSFLGRFGFLWAKDHRDGLRSRVSPPSGRSYSVRHSHSIEDDEFQGMTPEHHAGKCRMTRSRSADSILLKLIGRPVEGSPLQVDEATAYVVSRQGSQEVLQVVGRGSDSEVEQAEEAVEGSQLFSNIVFTGTEKRMEVGKGPYILYCIQYDALFSSGHSNSSEPPVILRTVSVRRRFREFVTLQARLEDNDHLRRYIKGIKGPNKWLTTPFSSLDNKNVEERRVFLQKYLRHLCARHEVANSVEMREFLAYGHDASLAYVRKPVELPVPRIDKMLARGVRGAIDLLKTKLPSLPQELGSSPGLIASHDGHNRSLLLPSFSRSRYEKHHIDIEVARADEWVNTLEHQITSFLHNFDLASSLEESESSSPDVQVSDRTHFFHNSGTSAATSSTHNCLAQPEHHSKTTICNSVERKATDVMSEATWAFVDHDIPLTSAVLDLGLESIQNPHHLCNNATFIVALKLLFGDTMERWLRKQLETVTSPTRCVQYLHLLHLVLWPPPNENSSWKQCSPEEGYQAALEALKCFFGKLQWIVGPGQLVKSLTLLLEPLQQPQWNRCLAYQALDMLMEMVSTPLGGP